MTEREKRVQWFQNARFGMFLHWGLYAIPGRGEWYMSNARIPAEQYERYMQEFTAKAYDPRDWARRAKRSRRNCSAFFAFCKMLSLPLALSRMMTASSVTS